MGMAKWKGETSECDWNWQRVVRACVGVLGCAGLFCGSTKRLSSEMRLLVWSKSVKCCIQLSVGYHELEERSSTSMSQICLPNCASGREECRQPGVESGW